MNLLTKPHRIIVFSKDRPWQLQQLIRSMQLNEFIDHDVDIIILYTASSDDFRLGYLKVQEEFKLDKYLHSDHFSIHWWKEGSLGITSVVGDDNDDHLMDFASLLELAIEPLREKECEAFNSSKSDLIMFFTDDCILLQPLQELWNMAKYMFEHEGRLLAFCSRLHPGITYSQTTQTISPPPSSKHFNYVQINTKDHPINSWETTGAILYPMSCAMKEYAYPFDLSGGIYRQSLVRNIMKGIQLKQLSGLYSHPNHLEVNGNQILFQKMIMDTDKTSAYIGIPSIPSLLILAINRVQEVYQAPLACHEEDINRMTPHKLLHHLHHGIHLNVDQYRNIMYPSSHIGDVHWMSNQITSKEEIDSDSVPAYKLSVLIPVHTGPPSAAALAIESILQPVLLENELSPMQIVIVDDGCNDHSIDVMLDQSRTFSSIYQKDVTVHICMITFENTQQKIYNVPTSLVKGKKWIDIIVVPSSTSRNTNVGIGAAINVGLQYCQSEYVARMDADDVSCPHRLSRQLSYLRQRKDIHIVGTNGVLFSDTAILEPSSSHSIHTIRLPYDSSGVHYDIVGTAIQPMQSGFIDWAMMFSCVLMHPSVMFRKSIILNEYGYGTNNQVCGVTEDYDLWLRIQRRHAKCMMTLPVIGICHRKHSNRTYHDTRQQQQRNESVRLSCQIMMEYVTSEHDSFLSSSLEDHLVIAEAILIPRNIASLENLNQAALMLVQLEKAFLRKSHSALTAHEISLIHYDCTERIGELVTIGIEKFGRHASKGYAWSVWEQRDPSRTMDRVSLLLSCIS